MLNNKYFAEMQMFYIHKYNVLLLNENLELEIHFGTMELLQISIPLMIHKQASCPEERFTSIRISKTIAT